MLTEKKTTTRKAATKKKVVLTSNIKLGTNLYSEGDEIEVTDTDYKVLKAANVIREVG